MTADIAIASWVDPRHLSPTAGRALRSAYAGHPARAVVIPGFLQAPIAERLARFLAEDAEFATGFGLKTRYGYVPEREWRETPEGERFFRYGSLVQARRSTVESPGFATFLSIREAFEAPETRAYFAALTGLRLGAITTAARRMTAEDFLVEHTDDIGGRVLSFVLYLTPGWRPEWGGELYLDDGGGAYAHRVDPEFNSLVLFDARAWHKVAPFTDALGDRCRYTFGGWFMSPTAD
ncbi:MAG: hypothetical protein EP329_15775 [Deltaproteobacteria bacterium]|nr:MAG: hypothetical protein EP329_15775 [Deltaproteobacteria bacterium]